MRDGERSLDALRQAILQALMDSGQLTPDMLKVLRGESTGDASERQGDRAPARRAARQDRPAADRRGLPQRRARRRRCPQGYQSMFGPQRPGALGGAARAVQPHREGHRLPRLQDPQEPARHRRQVELRQPRHAVSRHRHRSRRREQAVRVRRRAEPRRQRRRSRTRSPAQGARRPDRYRVLSDLMVRQASIARRARRC